MFDITSMIDKMKEVREFRNPKKKEKKDPNEVCGVLYPEDIISDEEIAEEFRAMRLGRQPNKSIKY